MDNIQSLMNSEFNLDKFKVEQRKSRDTVASGWKTVVEDI
jgi:hypothetical protein